MKDWVREAGRELDISAVSGVSWSIMAQGVSENQIEKEEAVPKEDTSRVKRILLPLAFSIACILALVLIIEIPLRIFTGLPKGRFEHLLPRASAMYPRNDTIEMTWGIIPYTVTTNSLGFRGRDIAPSKPGGVLRIAAIGDSATDGIFMDNDATYPHFLERILIERYGNIEVINAGYTGYSIDMENYVLSKLVLPLEPDLILLTFITNDVSDIMGKPLDELLSISYRQTPRRKMTNWLVTGTAIGELWFDFSLKLRSPYYRAHERDKNAFLGIQDRYQIRGGRDFIRNTAIFNERCREADGLVLNEPFSPEVKQAISNYLAVLKEMAASCKQQGAQFIFVYFPAYSQVYDLNTSVHIIEVLQDACAEISVPFFDLTDAFRREGRNTVLHLAPLDYHLNPTGNKVMAAAIADFLTEGRFLTPK